jgi:hypothetical protein
MPLQYPIPRGIRQTPDYIAAGGQVAFDVPFVVLDPLDLWVGVKPVGGNAFAQAVLTTDYTVTPLALTATVTFNAGRAAGDLVRIMGKRNPSRLQSTTADGAIQSSVFEKEQSAHVLTMQELRRDFDAIPSIDLLLISKEELEAILVQNEAVAAAIVQSVTDAQNYANLAIAAAPGNVYSFPTYGTIALTVIPASMSFLQTAGYTAAGDGGGGLYKKLGSAPGVVGPWHAQSSNGLWYELVGPHCNVKQLGCKVDGATDDTTLANKAVEFTGTRGGGIVSIPAGTIIANMVVGAYDNVYVRGAGQGVTIHRPVAATDVPLTLGDGATTRNNLLASHITWAAAVGAPSNTQTAGAMVRVTKVNSCQITQFETNGAFKGVEIITGSTGVTVKGARLLNTLKVTGVSIDLLSAAGPTYISDIFADGTAGTGNEPLAGIRLRQATSTLVRDVDLVHQGTGLLIAPAAAETVRGVFLAGGCIFDSCAADAIGLAPATGAIYAVDLGAAWASASDMGVNLKGTGTIDGVRLAGGQVYNNAKHGVQVLNASATNVVLAANLISGNSASAANTYHGVSIAANVGGVTITGNRIGQLAGLANTHAYNVLITAGSGDNIIVQGNDLRGFGTGALIDNSGGASKIIGGNIPLRAYQSYVPTAAPTSGAFSGSTVVTGKYFLTEKQVHVTGTITIANTNTGGGAVRVSLPFAALNAGLGLGSLTVASTKSGLQGRIGAGNSYMDLTRVFDDAFPATGGIAIQFAAMYERA